MKLQTFRVGDFVRRRDERRYRQLAGFELPPDEVTALAGLARELGVLFISTPLDLGSVDLLEPLVDAYKVASGDNDFLPLLDRLADGEPAADRLDRAPGPRRGPGRTGAHRGTPRRAGARASRSCTPSRAYPCPPEQVNLAAIPALAHELGCPVGYSDHTLGMEACVAGGGAGRDASSRSTSRCAHDFSEFRDHQLSAEPGRAARAGGRRAPRADAARRSGRSASSRRRRSWTTRSGARSWRRGTCRPGPSSPRAT